MNSPSRVISFVNAGHFIDHYAMLIFAAAVIIMGPALGMAYSELLPYATPGFIAFGAGSLLTGWLGDRWSRRHMMLIFFIGIGLAMISVGFVQTPAQLGAALVRDRHVRLDLPSRRHRDDRVLCREARPRDGAERRLGQSRRRLVRAGHRRDRPIFRLALCLHRSRHRHHPDRHRLCDACVVHEDRKGSKQAAAQARVAKQDMWRVILSLLIVVIAISTTFNAVTVALPKLFAERLADLTKSPALLGVIAACVYVFGAMTQYTIGRLLDRYSLKTVALPLSFMLAPFLYLAASLSNLPLILVSIGIVMGAFGQVTVNDAMVGKYTSEEWRSRAYAVRYFIGFTAAGASVGLVAWLYEQGGFVTMLHAFAGLCLLAIAAAIILPREIRTPQRRRPERGASSRGSAGSLLHIVIASAAKQSRIFPRRDSGLLRCARNDGRTARHAPAAAHDAIMPVFCPTEQSLISAKSNFTSLINPIPTVHGVVFALFS